MSGKKNEHRYSTVGLACESRAEGGLMLRGYAAVWDAETVISGMFREVFRRGAFTAAIGRDDVRALFNHDRSSLLGRSSNQTLRLTEDDKGLAIEIDLPETSVAADIHKLVERGDLSQMSLSFYATQTRWTAAPDALELREILEVELIDVSVVTFPAYEMTEVEARSVVEAEHAAPSPEPDPESEPTAEAEPEPEPDAEQHAEQRAALWLEEQRCRLALMEL